MLLLVIAEYFYVAWTFLEGNFNDFGAGDLPVGGFQKSVDLHISAINGLRCGSGHI